MSTRAIQHQIQARMERIEASLDLVRTEVEDAANMLDRLMASGAIPDHEAVKDVLATLKRVLQRIG